MSNRVTAKPLNSPSLLERISMSRAQLLRDWPEARRESALREAEVSSSYWIRVQDSDSATSTGNKHKKPKS